MRPGDEIHAWITGPRDYRRGVEIYSRVGSNPHLMMVFSRMNKPDKLLYEMQKLAAKYPTSIATREKAAPAKSLEKQEKKTIAPVSTPAQAQKMKSPERQQYAPWRMPKDTDPEEIVSLKQQFTDLLNERRTLHLSLNKHMRTSLRGERAFRILAIKPELDLIDHKLKTFHDTGSLPVMQVDIKADVSDRASIQARIETLKIYIRRTATGKKMENPARHEYYCREKDELEKILAK